MIKSDIYLDYAATTPMDKEVLELVHKTNILEYGNPGSLHEPGRLAKKQIEKARAEIAGHLKADPNEIIFTGSGTEADNLAILGVARASKHHGKHIIISAIEHKAILESALRLKDDGFEVSYAPVDKNGILDITKNAYVVNAENIF